ncbi:hypothetical protein ACQCT5_10380 [Sutcliffiella halmapala]
MNHDQWLTWQKQVIREERREEEIRKLNSKTQLQFNATVKDSLRKVELRK